MVSIRSLAKIVTLLIVALVTGAVLLLVFLNVANRLSRPSDLEQARRSGDNLATLSGQTILVVAAHPDDTDWYAGATLALLRQNGNRVIAVVATSGEKGGNSTASLAELRETEQREAARILDLDEVLFLRYPDRNLKPDNELKQSLKDIFNKYQPGIVFAFDTEREAYIYHHSDHRAAGMISREVAEETAKTRELYLFHSRDPDVIVDVSETTPAKIEALAAHASQRNPQVRPLNWILRLIPVGFRAGSNQSFPEIGVSEAEVFRKVSLTS